MREIAHKLEKNQAKEWFFFSFHFPFVWITTIQSWTALLESHYDLVVASANAYVR